jgi:hypothetical protein
MSEEASERRNWTDEELDLIVADYFSMLNDEVVGVPFNKAAHNRFLRDKIVRSEGSIEFKHQNISAVLQLLGLPRIRGYLPAWISQEDGDGAGYDILSFDEKGKERFLEVKTTVGSDITPFYITRNELSLSSERPEAFRLCRVFDFSIRPRMFELAPPLKDFVHLSPLSYEASFS